MQAELLAETPCPSCTKAQANPHAGAYRMQCLACCTRLVMSAHPIKRQAAQLLHAATRHPQTPGRAAILASVARCLGKPP